ncbi:hypothetical protein Ancab_007286 [Ancistrocladus abbreviatus]
MSSCGGKCSCGSGCGCGSSCNCRSCGVEEATASTVIAGVAPVQTVHQRFAADGEGCKCGNNCQCDPCTC